jgi:hypothetical protein
MGWSLADLLALPAHVYDLLVEELAREEEVLAASRRRD